ncbi:hypothetical protein JCM10295v2_006311 [Rhodotorula toruloides]
MADMRAYELETNEALERRRVVSVSDGATGRTIWTETRELVGEEIVSTVFVRLATQPSLDHTSPNERPQATSRAALVQKMPELSNYEL